VDLMGSRVTLNILVCFSNPKCKLQIKIMKNHDLVVKNFYKNENFQDTAL